MNQQQRKRLAHAQALLEELSEPSLTDEQRDAKLGEARSIVEEVRDENQESFDNLNEGLQGSERGQALQDAADSLDSIDWGTLEALLDPKMSRDETWTDDVADAAQTISDEIDNVM